VLAVIGLALTFALLGPMIIDLMARNAAVQDTARLYLPWMVAAPLFGLASYMLDGIFIGATRTRDMRNMMALSLATYVLAAAFLLPAHGNHGLWAALLISFVARALSLGLRYPALERAARPPSSP
jgi:MATE family multidrug resistance protein